MKILLLSHLYPNKEQPINGIFVHQQVKALQNIGLEIKVIKPVPYTTYPLPLLSNKWAILSKIPKHEYYDNVEVFHPRFLSFPKKFQFHLSGSKMFYGVKETVKKIRNDFKFDLVHSHVALPDGDCGLRIGNYFNVPTVVTVHGADLNQTIYHNQLCRDRICNVFNQSSKVIFVSNYLKKLAIENCEDNNNYNVIHNGIPFDKLNKIYKEYVENKNSFKTLKSYGKVVILSVSNLIKTKGIDLNLKAIGAIAKNYPNLEYKIIGDGPEKNNLIKLTKELNLENHVHFLGRLDHDRTLKEMAKCDIFSLPSWKEGFGIVYLEAMALGKPVIGVEGQGISDIVKHKHSGFLVKPRDITDLTKILYDILMSQNIHKAIGLNARNAMSEYSWENNANIIFTLYNKIVIK